MAALLWVAGGPQQEKLILPVVINAVIYGLLAIWARRSPLTAVLVGFVLYLLGIAVGLAQGDSIFDGILFKVILLALFLNGIGAGRQYNAAKQRVARQSPDA